MADCFRALGTDGMGSNISLFILKRSMVVVLAASFSLDDLGSIPPPPHPLDFFLLTNKAAGINWTMPYECKQVGKYKVRDKGRLVANLFKISKEQ